MDAQIYQFRKQPVIAVNPWVDGIAVMQGATQFMAIYAGSMLAFHVAMVKSGINAMTGVQQ